MTKLGFASPSLINRINSSKAVGAFPIAKIPPSNCLIAFLTEIMARVVFKRFAFP